MVRLWKLKKSRQLLSFQDGNIPLFLAVDSNNQGAYRELLGQYSDEQLRYQNPRTGNSVLHLACEKRDAEMVRLFCKKGTMVNIQNVSLGEELPV